LILIKKKSGMKKWLMGIAFILSIVMIVQQLRTNEYASAKKLAEAGNYPSFPTSTLGMHTNVDRANEDIHSQAGAWERGIFSCHSRLDRESITLSSHWEFK